MQRCSAGSTGSIGVCMQPVNWAVSSTAAACAQVHLNKRLPSGERRQYDISEEEFHDLAFQFQRFSGAMLANLVNTAVILAGRQGRARVQHDDLVEVMKRPSTTN